MEAGQSDLGIQQQHLDRVQPHSETDWVCVAPEQLRQHFDHNHVKRRGHSLAGC